MRGHLLLVGMMATGKTTVGRLLAARLDRPFFDSDEQVERATGRPVVAIFAAEGEAAFRAVEREALATALASPAPAVVAVAGGAVLDPANRALLRSAGTAVWLRARAATLAGRAGDGADRPLLAGDPAGVLGRLVAERADLYAEVADAVVDVDDLPPEEVATRVLAAARRGSVRRIRVDAGVAGYEVLVGPGAREHVRDLLPPRARRVAVVTQPGIPGEVPLEGMQCAVHRFEIPPGERAKRLATVEELCRGLARAGFTRDDAVVSLGGGVVSDVAGLAAALYHRGIPVAHVPTTLLGQVDAAIGGKTAVNLPEGKNLVGAYWQPAGVCCDTDLLATLPSAEWRSGRGEMVKCELIGAGTLAGLPLEEQVARCVALKAAVVGADERDAGRRMVLNYGHTLGHALEAAGLADRDDGGGLRHGEAVAVGLVYAARLACRLGRIDEERVAAHVRLLAAEGLPVTLPPGADHGQLLVMMGRDKKATAGLTFVLDGPAGVEVVPDVRPDDALAALDEMEGVGA